MTYSEKLKQQGFEILITKDCEDNEGFPLMLK
jgi:hypothetical protein